MEEAKERIDRGENLAKEYGERIRPKNKARIQGNKQTKR